MRFKNYLIGLFIAVFAFIEARSQDFDASLSLNYSLDLYQVKDVLNYGLVFTGPMHHFYYKNSWKINGRNLMYQGDFGLGLLFSKGIIGFAVRVKPVDIYYEVFDYNIRELELEIGPWVKMDYNYQLYPELQDGFSIHSTNYTLGFALSVKYQSDNAYLRLRWKNSIAGLISRSPEDRDPYFYELSLSTYFRDQHKDFSAGSFNLYNNTSIEILYVNPIHPRLGYAYTFEYFSYSEPPKLKTLSHSLALFFYLKI